MSPAATRMTRGAGPTSCPAAGARCSPTRADGNLSTAPATTTSRVCDAGGSSASASACNGCAPSPQVHGTTVQPDRRVIASGGAPAPVAADGHATALRGLGTMVLAADCLPVALGCEGAVAMVHAGWRGLAAGVLEQGVRALGELAARAAIVAVVGPGAGVCCYEVGPEVHEAFGGAHRARAQPRPARDRARAAARRRRRRGVRRRRRARSATSASSRTAAKARAPGARRGSHG